MHDERVRDLFDVTSMLTKGRAKALKLHDNLMFVVGATRPSVLKWRSSSTLVKTLNTQAFARF